MGLPRLKSTYDNIEVLGLPELLQIAYSKYYKLYRVKYESRDYQTTTNYIE